MVGNLLLLKSKRILYINTHTNTNTEITKVLGILVDHVVVAYDEKDAIALYEDESPDFIFVDVRSPDKEIVKLIKQLRQNDYAIPIIVMALNDDQEMLMNIANLSIDAYLYKPFITHQLLAETLCKTMKRNSIVSGLIILNKQLIFNLATKKLYSDGQMIDLGAKEHQLLLLLIENRHRTLTKSEIEKELWPLQSVSGSAVKKLILRIRHKMQANIIISVRGIGYRLDIKETKITSQQLISA